MQKDFDELLPSFITQDDINQEAELLKLEGKIPHRGIIRKQLMHESSDLHFSHWLPAVAETLTTTPNPLSNKDYNKLVTYLYSLKNVSTSIISHFLDNPDNEDALEQLLHALYIGKHLKKKDWIATKPKSKSVRILILEILKKHTSLTKEEIYQYISYLIVSKRPASVTREGIQLLLNSGDIQEINNDSYTVTNQ